MAANPDSRTRVGVLVLSGSRGRRVALVRVLEKDPTLHVAGSVDDWAHGSRSAAWLKPDVIVVDLDDDRRGLEASRRIMRESPTPIVMVIRGSLDSQRALVPEAMSSGAVAVVPAPPDDGPPSGWTELFNTVRNMATVKVVRHRDAGLSLHSPRRVARERDRTSPSLIAIGASTGGPPALRDVLTRLPETFPIPVVVVQHMAAGFVASLVDWLAPQCRLPVRLAVVGDQLDYPAVHVAPSDHHLIVRGRALGKSDDPPVSGQRPSATVLFRSVAEAYGERAVGVLLTGMGEDGALGLREMKRVGALTVVQDEESSVVFGMPGAAIRLDAAGHILSPPAIASLLLELVDQKVAS